VSSSYLKSPASGKRPLRLAMEMTRKPKPAFAVGALAAVIAVLGIAIWSIKRHRAPELALHCDAPFEELIPSLSGLTLGTPMAGNTVEIFENGAFFDTLLDDIAAAKRTVHFETFLWKEGKLGQRMADAFSERARAGVKVRLMLDAAGCRKMGEAARGQLSDAGCHLAFFHPRTPNYLGVVVERDHRKIAVLDGRVAWVGGHCIVDEWLGDARNAHEVRDLSVRLRGPIVHAVQSAFSENWVGMTGELFAGDGVFMPLEKAGDVVAHLASVKPEGSAPAVKILHHMAILCARKTIRIQSPYFIPEPAAIKALAAAVKRGVDVRIMVPSTEASDTRAVQHAAHRTFQRLLDSGVRVFEYQKTLLHQKVITVDGIWSAVGSSNFDDRSFETNDEITLGFLDKAFARRLETIFEKDCAECIELQAKAWRQRGLWHRTKDNASYLLNEVL
jgi:cardiolipin synthase A/B